MKILLTGATGYIGGRLLRRLGQTDHYVRCMARKPEHLSGRLPDNATAVEGDVLKPDTLDQALEGIDTAYYLIHSMGGSGGFVEKDRRAAVNFGAAAKRCGVRRIIYLGGLGDDSQQLSDHLKSRHETGEMLRKSGVTVIEFRASVIIGSGSLSFEMVRALVEKLPVMTTPKWVYVEAQPLAIEDLLEYLVEALEPRFDRNRIFEIGGREIVSYAGMMQEYARQRGLRRLIIPVPLLTPWLSSLWLGLVTPVFARIGRKLIEGVRHPTVVKDKSALQEFAVEPRGCREAIDRAIANEDKEFAETHWSDAQSSVGTDHHWGGKRLGSRLVDSRSKEVHVDARQAFAPIQNIGGDQGWYYANALWRLRGFIDLLWGGVGMRHGRSEGAELRPGQVIDWWRVEKFEPDRLLRLRAEMKLPGRAWLQFEVEPTGPDSSIIYQTALFDPQGLKGLLYWYGIYPLHALVFRGMLRNIATRATKMQQG